MSKKSTQKFSLKQRDHTVPTVGAVLGANTLVELLYDRERNQTDFAIFENGTWRRTAHIADGTEQILVPYAPDNNLLRHSVVQFPSAPVDYGTESKLAEEVRAFIHRYTDLDGLFEWIATYYVLLSWLYDCFNELPYLRV